MVLDRLFRRRAEPDVLLEQSLEKTRRGVFSEINPAITCPDGTYHRVGLEEVGFLTSTCKNASG